MGSSRILNNVICIMNVLMMSLKQSFVQMDYYLKMETPIMKNVTTHLTLTVEQESLSVSFKSLKRCFVLPINVFITSTEEPETGGDARCYRANGFFNHEEPNECNK